MSKQYFNVNIEFDKAAFDYCVFEAIKTGKVGYVCSIERNNITVANNDPAFLQVVNGALVNNCDGSVLASILGQIHGQKLESYIGGDIFLKYIGLKTYRHYFLGNNREILDGLKNRLSQTDPRICNMIFEPLPFNTVNEFDYPSIAAKINADNPDMIWVSLGAPKQELFMSMLQPFLNRGIMFGIGAAFNFNSGVGNVHRAPLWMRKCKLEWVHRILVEPKKNLPRSWSFVKILPRLVKEERQKIKNKKR